MYLEFTKLKSLIKSQIRISVLIKSCWLLYWNLSLGCISHNGNFHSKFSPQSTTNHLAFFFLCQKFCFILEKIILLHVFWSMIVPICNLILFPFKLCCISFFNCNKVIQNFSSCTSVEILLTFFSLIEN